MNLCLKNKAIFAVSDRHDGFQRFTPIDNQKAAEYFEKSAELGNQYASGKNFEQDIDKGSSLLTECADSGDVFSCYKLGKLHFFGIDGLEKDKEKAMHYLSLSADQGSECAQNILDNQERFEKEMLANTIFSLFVNLSRCIKDGYHRAFQSGRKMIDRKLRRVIREKKQALGMKEELSQEQSY